MFSNLAHRLRTFSNDRRGAVTADFVVLTAGVIVIFMLMIQPIYEGSQRFILEINDALIAHASNTWKID